MVDCKFFYSKQEGIYKAGEILQVRVEFILDECQTLSGLYYVVKGEGTCHFRKPEDQNLSGVWHRGNFIYVNVINYLRGSENGEPFQMEKGTYVFNIACELPINLPPTFTDKYGSILYSVTTVMDYPMENEKSKKFQSTFQILPEYDLNNDPDSRMTIEMEDTSTISCFSFRTKPIEIAVNIPQSGFIVGQNIPINLDVNNQSKYRIRKFSIFLWKRILINTQTPEKKANIIMETVTKRNFHQPILANEHKRITLDFKVPETHFTMINTNLIDITYQIRIKASPDGCRCPIQLFIPIIIGTIPLDVQQLTEHIPINIPVTLDAYNPLLNSGLLPPSYKECVPDLTRDIYLS